MLVFTIFFSKNTLFNCIFNLLCVVFFIFLSQYNKYLQLIVRIR